MAKNRQLIELAEEKHEMQMTPMIDVTFLLLIFFMCTLKFKTLEGKLSAYLPKDVGVNQQDAEPIEKVEILVRVRNAGTKMKPLPGKEFRRYEQGDTGRFVYGDDRKLEYSVANFKTDDLKKLGKRLQTIYKQRKAANEEKIPSTIDARAGTIYEDITGVLDEAIEAGFKDITFVGAYDEGIK